MLAEMAIGYEATRLLCHKAAAGIDAGKPDSIVSSYAKAYGADAAMEASTERRPDLRRLRLHQGLPGREADARREAAPDLRGDQPDPAHGHRPQRPRRVGVDSADRLSFRNIGAADVELAASVFVECFSAPPWNEPWTLAAAVRRIGLFASAPTFRGVLALEEGRVVAMAVGQVEGLVARKSVSDPRRSALCRADRTPELARSCSTTSWGSCRGTTMSARSYLLTDAASSAESFYVARGFHRSERKIVLSLGLGMAALRREERGLGTSLSLAVTAEVGYGVRCAWARALRFAERARWRPVAPPDGRWAPRRSAGRRSTAGPLANRPVSYSDGPFFISAGE